jgi:hypothetical protein
MSNHGRYTHSGMPHMQFFSGRDPRDRRFRGNGLRWKAQVPRGLYPICVRGIPTRQCRSICSTQTLRSRGVAELPVSDMPRTCISYSPSQDTVDSPRRVPQYTSASREHTSPPTTYTYYPSTTRRSNDHPSPSTEQPDLPSVEQKKPTSRRTCELMQEPTSAQSDIHVSAAHERARCIRARYDSLGESHTALKNRATSTGWAGRRPHFDNFHRKSARSTRARGHALLVINI